ncbi:FecR family protein [Sphingobacterium pedocola]|uniref:Anti-sigma factor n=1 Tax=Sphingobacterium pedocola TaxID=2082722 RepID=A0ABR9T366_9SPHI|nr:FecR family protein [Sphingobacterium pedocola]MBE8719791.1 anti-sigma factor [Sphingobacterium pedocola]
MDTNPLKIADILVKMFKNESISEDERQFLDVWLKMDSRNRDLFDELLTSKTELDGSWLERIDEENAWTQINNKRNRGTKKHFSWMVAASIALLFSLSFYLFFNNSDFDSQPRFVKRADTKYTNDILPANLGAKIVLANGKEVKVDDTLTVPQNGGLLAEDQITASIADVAVLNTLVVPTAKFFKLTLSDGTIVWVNSNSELKFPTQFNNTERRVFLSGEAYFEVAKDVSKPFYVETEDLKVKVLGTHFNVSTYGAKSKTSLKEGSVEVSKDAQSVIISPGQSAEWSTEGLKVRRADLQKDLAWKNNEFYFKGDNIINIANQLKRWYDLEVVFSKEVSLTDTYSGEIRRDVRLSEVLKMLEFVSELDFKLDKNKLLITKK